MTVAAGAPFEALSLRGPALRVNACNQGERRMMYRVALLGVTAVWMPFLQAPVNSPEELALQLRLCLTCRCRNHEGGHPK